MASGRRSEVFGGYVSMARPLNCLMGALGVLLASVVCAGLDGLDDYVPEIALSIAVVALFTAGGNYLNDYFDRDVDRKAHPSRPIPRGLVRPGSALWLSMVVFGATALLGWLIGPVSFLIVVTSVGVMLAYEVLLKSEGLAGNLAISWLTGAVFLFGGAAVDAMDLAWILALLAFLATLGRELIKDIQDLAGDEGHRRTLPMRLGPRKAGAVASASLAGAIALSPAPYLMSLLDPLYLPVVLVADAIFIYSAMIHFSAPERGQKVVKLAMLAALVAFLVGGVF